MNLSDLRPAPYNPRTMTESAASGLDASVKTFGDISGIVFNLTTGRLVAGHQRVQSLMRQYGDLAIDEGAGVIRTVEGAEFDIRFVEWDQETERAANLTANNPFIQGDFTADLEGLLDGLSGFDGFVELQMAEMRDELDRLVSKDESPPSPGGDTPPPEPDDDYEPVTQPGDLIELGRYVQCVKCHGKVYV